MNKYKHLHSMSGIMHLRNYLPLFCHMEGFSICVGFKAMLRFLISLQYKKMSYATSNSKPSQKCQTQSQ